jgi:N-acetylglucosamine-6-phosphate deacetylase
VNRQTAVAIDAGTLYTPFDQIAPARIVVDGSAIAEFGSPDAVRVPSSAQYVDASQYVVTPGFIEPHIHGCGGIDLMTATYDSLNAVSRIIARHGTTAFMPTTVSSTAAVLSDALDRISAAVLQEVDGAQPLGIHLEGPFISPLTRGTHDPANILAPDLELFHQWIQASRSTIRLITLAPELDPNGTVAMMASSYGIRAAMGHSNATFEESVQATGRGVCYAVHTFNAMRGFSHRDPGIIGAVLSDDRVFAEIIADGIHVHPAVVQLFARAKRAERIVLVTDAMSATDMPDGEYSLGPGRVTVTNGICRDRDGRLAGSTLTQEIALKNFVQWTGFSLRDALLGLTANPAAALGLTGKGVVRIGADADFAVLDSNFHVMKTMVAGKLVFER